MFFIGQETGSLRDKVTHSLSRESNSRCGVTPRTHLCLVSDPVGRDNVSLPPDVPGRRGVGWVGSDVSESVPSPQVRSGR